MPIQLGKRPPFNRDCHPGSVNIGWLLTAGFVDGAAGKFNVTSPKEPKVSTIRVRDPSNFESTNVTCTAIEIAR